MLKLVLLSIVFFSLITTSHAYLGPGIGGGVLMATLGIIIAILAALFGLIWFPIKRLLQKKTKKNQKINKID